MLDTFICDCVGNTHIICRQLSSQVNHSPKKLKYEKLTVLKVKEKENVQSKKGQVTQTEKKTTVSKGTFLLEITYNIAAAL